MGQSRRQTRTSILHGLPGMGLPGMGPPGPPMPMQPDSRRASAVNRRTSAAVNQPLLQGIQFDQGKAL